MLVSIETEEDQSDESTEQQRLLAMSTTRPTEGMSGRYNRICLNRYVKIDKEATSCTALTGSSAFSSIAVTERLRLVPLLTQVYVEQPLACPTPAHILPSPAVTSERTANVQAD